LYHQAAILCIDGSNDLHLLVGDDKVFVYLINKDAKCFIPPNIASTVQECLTLTMTKVLEFYHKSFGKSLSTSEVEKAFEIEVREWCTSGYISVPEVKEKTEWRCQHNKTHDTTCPLYKVSLTLKIFTSDCGCTMMKLSSPCWSK
jgi:serine kinase of HPr protein (carbohydrate metabolism regulator)